MSTPPREPHSGQNDIPGQGYGEPATQSAAHDQQPYSQQGQPGPAQYGYGEPAYQGMTTDNGKATAAMICGILGIVLTVLFWPVGVVLDIVAIVLGVLASREIKRSGGMQRGAGKAKAGLICGVVGLVLLVLLLGFLAANYDEIMRQAELNK